MSYRLFVVFFSTPFSKADDLILVAETESDSVRQKVTTHVIGSVLVQCCCNAQMKESYFSVAVRVFHFLERKIKNIRACDPAEVRCKQFGEGIFFLMEKSFFYWKTISETLRRTENLLFRAKMRT